MQSHPVVSTAWSDLSRTEFPGHASWRTLFVNRAMTVAAKPALFAASVAYLGFAAVAPTALRHTSFAFTDYVGVALPPIAGTTVAPVQLPHCTAEWVVARGVSHDAPVVVHFHGGGFLFAGRRTHRRLLSRISAVSGVRVLSVAYRMLPKWTLAEVVEDALDAYRHVLDSGVHHSAVVLAGDSAGAYPAVMAAVAARRIGLPPPAGHVLLSGLLDLDGEAKRKIMARHPDPLFPAAAMRLLNGPVLSGGVRQELPESATDGDLAGFGPFLIQVGSHEVLRHDAEQIADRLAAVGVACRLQIWDRAPHDFQLAADILPDGRQAIADIGAFIALATAARRPAIVAVA